MGRIENKKNILFLTLLNINSIEERGIYQDLLRKFRDEGHDVTIVTPVERRTKISTNLSVNEGVKILQVGTFNIQKSNLIEKGIGTLAIEYQYLNAIKRYLGNFSFDLVIYTTPPITYGKIIKYIKKRDNAYTYLLLKDIFPQNAVDMKMMKNGSFLHKYFQKKERALYELSDSIGCMSEANRDYILKHNPHLVAEKIEINPNSILPNQINLDEEAKAKIRTKYDLPLEKKIFVYGGNLGKPQGLEFLLETIGYCDNPEAYFLIIGDGTEYNNLLNWFLTNNPSNAKLLRSVPKQEYDTLLATCDIGLIFLHPDFTIPNFPSRLLSYLEMKKPVIAATDSSSDIGNILIRYNCGFKVLSGNKHEMQNVIESLIKANNFKELGENGWRLLNNEFHIDKSFELIIQKIQRV